MGNGGDSLEGLWGLCNYSQWQTLKNEPAPALTPRKEPGGRQLIALSPLPTKPDPMCQRRAVISAPPWLLSQPVFKEPAGSVVLLA